MDARGAFASSEMRRIMENMFQFGVVKDVSDDGTEASVQIGEELESAMLPILQRRAGKDSEKWTLSPGEQVFVVCPSGEIDAGVIIGALHQDSTKPSGNGKVRKYSDGVIVTEEYEKYKHKVNIDASKVGISFAVDAANFKLTVDGSNIDLEIKDKPMKVGITGKNASVSIDETGVLSFKGSQVALGSNDPTDGVITAKCICPLTGIPHTPASTFVMASLIPVPQGG